ncbi:MAG: hypothetical protein A2915_04860 [Candidatus Yanofskybacteria bacterium RIFCSPLOWO2_01_FULL_41_34]|nr:MAG: hypothetical protein A2915_04860 [Candidatus Yanofskybacteria bacterium RIFCSPLOWO2_01_FULL_41_34]
MLTQETKRKIDSARNILVGKVPDPKAQVEQITTALIYKFMDDMDKEAIELGGKARFFTKGFEKYAWTKLLDQKLGGHERLELYGEAVAKMSQNPHIPQLFRDIFKDAFLPYRSPETLTLFLKEINGFTYDHSEDLGNAFEYLLSILGSQGDAGQFRTPRHIIDFIARVVDPKKGDTILDPACGTAGFLISAYKHILKQQKDKPLTPDEKKKLMNNLVGYDISPDMVKLSKVNMYLHGFAEPKIFEYDTLSSEEKWDESFDVIMANPPFMSPQGGINPHKRFSVQANRSEVLFVDYIKEHLRPNGRAGIIVPEGIIFQSSGAYKQLRKMLVEDGLFAVVSLPAGVFNPYAGVKTSILFFDNSLAKKTDKILFVRILNDGFDLGAQRRPRPDLPSDLICEGGALDVLVGQRIAIETGVKNKWLQKNSLFAYEITKEQIAKTGDYNLSAERYRIDNLGEKENKKWTMIDLGEVAELTRGVVYAKEDEVSTDGFKILRANNISPDSSLNLADVRLISRKLKLKESQKLKNGDIFICLASGSKEHIGKVAFIDKDTEYYFGGFMGAIRTKNEKATPLFLFYLLRDRKFNHYLRQVISGANINNLNSETFSRYKIPLPPIKEQNEITNQLIKYQKVIDGAKQIISNYSPVIKVDSDWQITELGNLFLETKLGLVKDKSKQSEDFSHPYIKMDSISVDGYLDLKDITNVEATKEELEKYTLNDGDFIYNTRNAPNLVGKSSVYHGENGKYLFNNNILRIRFKKEADPDFINYYLNTIDGKNKIKALVSGTTSVAAIYQKNFATIAVPLPPIDIQKEIVSKIAQERMCVDSAVKTVELFENKIKEIIDGLL